jgi:Flp pilus assembly protein CpaB
MRVKPPARRRSPAGPRHRFRPGLALRRQPRLWWIVVAAAALTAGWSVSSAVAGAERSKAAWGTTRAVLVVQRARDAGEQLRAGDVALVQRPLATVPRTALGTLTRGAVLRAAVVEGEVVVAERLAETKLSAVAARLPAGTRAMAIPIDTGTAPPLGVGDRVDVLVALPVEAAGGGPPGFALADGARVVAVDEAAVTVAVPRALAPRVAVALGQGAVSLALVGGG